MTKKKIDYDPWALGAGSSEEMVVLPSGHYSNTPWLTQK